MRRFPTFVRRCGGSASCWQCLVPSLWVSMHDELKYQLQTTGEPRGLHSYTRNVMMHASPLQAKDAFLMPYALDSFKPTSTQAKPPTNLQIFEIRSLHKPLCCGNKTFSVFS